MNKEQFAEKIRTKYPQYSSVDTETLVTKIVDKYPTYATQITDLKPKTGFVDNAKSQFKEGGEKFLKSFQGVQQGAKKTNNLAEGLQDIYRGALGMASGGIQTVSSPLTAGFQKAAETKPVSKALTTLQNDVVQPYADAISNFPAVQKFAMENPNAPEVFSDALNVIGTVTGGPKVKGVITEAGTKVASNVVGAIDNTAGKVTNMAGKITEGIRKDIIPSSDRIVNTEVTRALDLTQGDVKNISASTGNEVGEFLANRNLIGNNLDDTVKNVDNFYKQNYDTVRSEINRVPTVYTPGSIPRYIEALTEIKKQIADVPGLQKANAELDVLLKKPNPTLMDVQKAKELMDEHFSLYKATGDVKESVAKEGLSNIRNDLKTFIEKEVRETTGADIQLLNNNVATARSIADAIATRSTRGLTRASISTGDIVTFLTGSAVATPLGGLAAVLAKKLYQSPSLKLKFAKWLDAKSDVKKLKILEDLKNGKIPEGIKVNQPKSSSKDSTSLKGSDSNLAKKTNIVSIPKTVTPKVGVVKKTVDKVKNALGANLPNKQGGFAKLPTGKIEKQAAQFLNKKPPFSLLRDLERFVDYVRLKKVPDREMSAIDFEANLRDALKRDFKVNSNVSNAALAKFADEVLRQAKY